MNQLMILTLLVFLSSLNVPLTCRFHEQNFADVEKVSVEAFKKKLLKELGFPSVPNVNKIKAPQVPSFYKRLIEAENTKPIQTSQLDEDDFLAKTNQLFLFPEQGKFFKRKSLNFIAPLLRKILVKNRSRNVTVDLHIGISEPLFPELEFSKGVLNSSPQHS